jgi:hypothetical protein
MRLIGKEEIENISIGAALLGTGGGGDPYIGKLMAIQAVEKYGPIKLLSLDDIDDDDLIVPSAMMGAPTVMVEKIPSGKEALVSFKSMEKILGKPIKATMPIEAGGVNSLLPLALAAELGLPVVDADGMGRAFPELQMVTFYIDGVKSTPMVLSDEKGNNIVLDTVDGLWAEKIARTATVTMGGSVMISIYPMLGRQVKESSINQSLSLEQKIGEIITTGKKNNVNPINGLLELLKGYRLFEGKVVDIERRTEGGFAKGVALIQGLGENNHRTCKLNFQNEHLLAESDGKLLCMTPDLITVLDAETGIPITTEGIRYGARCVVLGIPCDNKWRTKRGIELVGPRYFGYDTDYISVEELQK